MNPHVARQHYPERLHGGCIAQRDFLPCWPTLSFEAMLAPSASGGVCY
jgi:hypothetical protein